MSTPTVRAVAVTPALLGECPLWEPHDEVVYWLDIEGRVVHRHEPATGTNATRGLPGRPGALALGHAPGELFIAMEHEIVRFRWDDPAALESFMAVEAPGTGNRLNDGRTDPAGRFVVGSMWADSAAGKNTGALYQVSGGASRTLRRDVGCPNGLAFDASRARVYWTDTPTERVVVADYDASTGSWENERTFFDYTQIPGKPDGACVDAEGGYWSASVYGWSLVRISPDGELDVRVDLPVEKPSMPAFGGRDMTTLFITTIGAGGSVPSAPGRKGFIPGSLLAIDDIGVRGVSDTPFTT